LLVRRTRRLLRRAQPDDGGQRGLAGSLDGECAQGIRGGTAFDASRHLRADFPIDGMRGDRQCARCGERDLVRVPGQGGLRGRQPGNLDADHAAALPFLGLPQNAPLVRPASSRAPLQARRWTQGDIGVTCRMHQSMERAGSSVRR